MSCRPFGGGAGIPSVKGVAGGRERAARQRVEAPAGEPREAEAVWERFAIARETAGEVLAEPRGGESVPPGVASGGRPVRSRRHCPVRWCRLAGGTLPENFRARLQRIMDVPTGENARGNVMDCRQLATAIGLESAPAQSPRSSRFVRRNLVSSAAWKRGQTRPVCVAPMGGSARRPTSVPARQGRSGGHRAPVAGSSGRERLRQGRCLPNRAITAWPTTPSPRAAHPLLWRTR